MARYTAPLILLPDGLHKDIVLEYHEDGTLIGISNDTTGARCFEGILAPGFVNAHCHTELSYLRDCIPTGTGMVGFIKKVQELRQTVELPERINAARLAVAEMWEHGIQLVGDICNDAWMAAVAEEFPMVQWHHFVERFGLNPNLAGSALAQGMDILSAYPTRNSSLTPHAPYSMSLLLLRALYGYAEGKKLPLSIHLAESEEEMRWFADGSGPFAEFFALVGFEPPVRPGVAPYAHLLFHAPDTPILWIHNTELVAADADTILAHHPDSWFVLCPKANTYIHQTVPGLFWLTDYADRVCIGTDSLAGNTSLTILEEIQYLRMVYPTLSTEVLLLAATRNGARALGREATAGMLQVGVASAGLIHITGVNDGEISPLSRVQRIL